MKNLSLILLGTALVFSACNGASKKAEETEEMASINPSSSKNVMMEAMDESMSAMHHAKQTDNIDYNFVSMMIPHHEGAVKMAELLLKETKNVEMIAFAKEVIEEQQKEISSFKTFLATADQSKSANLSTYNTAIEKSMMPMMKGMSNVSLTGNLDHDFIALMIPHHESAVEMARAYLPYAKNREIKKNAEDIISSQEAQITWLKSKL